MPGFRFSPPSPQLDSKLPALPGHRMEAALPPRSAAQRNGGRAPRGGSAALPQPPASCPPPPLRPPRHDAGKGDRGGREKLERHHYAPRAQARRSCPPRQRYEPLHCRGGGEGGRSPPPSGRAAPLPPRGGYYLHFVSPPARPRPINMVPKERGGGGRSRGGKAGWQRRAARARPRRRARQPLARSSRRPSPTREAASPGPRAERALPAQTGAARESADRPKKEGGEKERGCNKKRYNRASVQLGAFPPRSVPRRRWPGALTAAR